MEQELFSPRLKEKAEQLRWRVDVNMPFFPKNQKNELMPYKKAVAIYINIVETIRQRWGVRVIANRRLPIEFNLSVCEIMDAYGGVFGTIELVEIPENEYKSV